MKKPKKSARKIVKPFSWSRVNTLLLIWVIIRVEGISEQVARLEGALLEMKDILGQTLIAVNVSMMQFYAAFQSSIQSILSLFGGVES